MIILSILLHILLGILIFIAAVIVLLLFIPFIYRSEGSMYGGLGEASIELSWLFNAVGFRSVIVTEAGLNSELRIAFFRKAMNFQKRKEKKIEKDADEETGGKKKKRRFTREKLVVLLNSAKKILARYKPRKIMIDAVVGFDDAYYTGLMCAGLSVVSPVLSPERNQVRIVPEFDETICEGRYMTEGRVVVFFIAWEALRIFFSRPFRTKK